jgi:hypothetical protein
MNYVLLGGAALVGALVLYQILFKADLRKVVRSMRWIVGGAVALLTALLLFRGQVGIASITAYLAFMILRFGRVGPWSFESTTLGEDNESTVRSRFITMTLDHDTGEVAGKVIAGAFKGADLGELGEAETRQLLGEVASDPDSLALLETWLDKNRAGWREYFAGEEPFGASDAGAGAAGGAAAAQVDPDQEAYEILGLRPGATAEEIRDAHRKLMMAVHPDQGGSNYLAARINAAKDRLLKKLGAK